MCGLQDAYFECKDKTDSTAGIDDSVGKHGLPLCTTTSKLQLKYRTVIQNSQKSS